ncbi:hypothetical protein U9M48_032576, partial [Paspalum notatum var. saurae]
LLAYISGDLRYKNNPDYLPCNKHLLPFLKLALLNIGRQELVNMVCKFATLTFQNGGVAPAPLLNASEEEQDQPIAPAPLLNASEEEQDQPIQNTVEWCLDGDPEAVLDSYIQAIGHHRLWNFANGRTLDVSSHWNHNAMIYTTAECGTFYFKVTYEDNWVSFPSDGRDGWGYGVKNKYRCFEFDHTDSLYLKTKSKDGSTKSPLIQSNYYLKNMPRWSLLKGCLGDYYRKHGLCPEGHEHIQLGLDWVRAGCKYLSNYKGELPVPMEFRDYCATFLAYGLEAVKQNQIFELTKESLKNEDVIELVALDPYASPRMKKWYAMAREKLRYFARELSGINKGIPVKIYKKAGILEPKHVLEAVNVIPFNCTLHPEESRRWTWTSKPIDKGADGRAHALSKTFACRWPYNQKMLLQTPGSRIINPSKIAAFPTTKRHFTAVAGRFLRFLPK